MEAEALIRRAQVHERKRRTLQADAHRRGQRAHAWGAVALVLRGGEERARGADRLVAGGHAEATSQHPNRPHTRQRQDQESRHGLHMQSSVLCGLHEKPLGDGDCVEETGEA